VGIDQRGTRHAVFELLQRLARAVSTRRPLPSSRALVLAGMSLLVLSTPARAQVLLLDSDPQVRALSEAVKIQLADRAEVAIQPLAAASDARKVARSAIETGAARLVLWIEEDDRPEPESRDYLLSAARPLPDGPGLEVVRLQAQSGAPGDRALSLRVAELYPERAAPLAADPPLATPQRSRDVTRAHSARLSAALLLQVQSTLSPLAPGLLLGCRLGLRSWSLVPELSGWWVPSKTIAENAARLELAGLGFATRVELLRALGAFDVGLGAALQWHAHRARAFTESGRQDRVTEWVPVVAPYLTLGLRVPRAHLYGNVSAGLAWALVEQTWSVAGESFRREPRFGPQGRVAAGVLF